MEKLDPDTELSCEKREVYIADQGSRAKAGKPHQNAQYFSGGY